MKFPILCVVASSLTIHSTVGAGIYTLPNKASIYAAIHGDYVSATGLTTASLTARGPVNTNNGFGRTLTIDSDFTGGQHLASWSTGVGAPNPVNVTTISSNTTARAFSCFLHVANNLNQSVGGQVNISTSSDVSTLTIPAGGMYVAFVSNFEFTSVTINAAGSGLVEMIDDVMMASLSGRPASEHAMDAGPAIAGSNPFDTTHACDDQFDFRFGTNYGNTHDVWWCYVPTAAGMLTADTFGANFDTLLGVYTSSDAPPFDAVFPTAFNDNDGGNQSRVSMHVAAGQRYYIRLGGRNGARGTGSLHISHTPDCEADFNHDGVIDFFDYLDFVQAFSTGC